MTSHYYPSGGNGVHKKQSEDLGFGIDLFLNTTQFIQLMKDTKIVFDKVKAKEKIGSSKELRKKSLVLLSNIAEIMMCYCLESNMKTPSYYLKRISIILYLSKIIIYENSIIEKSTILTENRVENHQTNNLFGDEYQTIQVQLISEIAFIVLNVLNLSSMIFRTSYPPLTRKFLLFSGCYFDWLSTCCENRSIIKDYLTKNFKWCG